MKNNILVFLVLILLSNCTTNSRNEVSTTDSSASITDNLRMFRLLEDKLEIIEIKPDDSSEIIYETSDLGHDVPTASKGNYILFNSQGLSIYDIGEDKFIEINDKSTKVSAGGFYNNQDLIFYSRLENEGDEPEIVIYNYIDKRVIKTLKGYKPSIGKTDDCLYFLQAENKISDQKEVYFRHIYKLKSIDGKEELVSTLELSEDGKYDIEEVIAKNNQEYYYNVYDEHEYSYYSDWTGTELKFFPSDDEEYKEQFNLCFSADKKYAAFAERNWNELTEIILVDLTEKKRIKTDAYGSFPYFHNNRLYFISDPNFVNTEDASFRQIEEYALYYFDMKNKKVVLENSYEGGIQIIK